jgi:hypothetical protein
MSKSLASVKTLTANEIAKKFDLPLATVAKKIAAGVKVEKEHTTSIKQANEIARDHLGERPDYYDKLHKMEKTKVVKENTTVTSGIGGLGFNTGTPAIAADNQYTDTNSMTYDDINGAVLKMIRDRHHKHLIDMGFTSYSPNDIQGNANRVVKEAKLNELGDYVKDGMPGYEGISGPIRAIRKNEMKERALSERGKVPADMTAAAERSIYQEASAEKLSSYTQAAAERLASGSDAGDRQKEVNRITGINTAVRKLHPDLYPGEVNVPVKEYWTPFLTQHHKHSARLSKEKSNKPDTIMDPGAGGTTHTTSEGWASITDPKTGKTDTYGEKPKEKPEVHEPGTDWTKPSLQIKKTRFAKTVRKEETKMDNKELINEALDCILEDNLSEMKDNLMKVLHEKATEKLEERKKEIAANYFAQ